MSPAPSLGARLLRALALLAIAAALVRYGVARLGEPSAAEADAPTISLARHDAELGWVTAPNLAVPDAFGPGSSLATNSAGFRGTAETAVAPSYPQRRVVFAGDGTVLGVGVDDAAAFPALIAAREPRVESVNLAVPDHGADQSFLRVLRDGLPLEPALVVLGVRASALQRVTVARSVAAKPQLALREGNLELENQPVPTGEAPLATRLGARVLGWFGVVQDPGLDPDAAARAPAEGFAPVAARALEELAGAAQRSGSALLLVYLPARADLDAPALPARRFVLDAAEQLGIELLDATPALVGGADDELLDEYGAPTALGHARIAEALLPRVREALRLGDAAAPAAPSTAEVIP